MTSRLAPLVGLLLVGAVHAKGQTLRDRIEARLIDDSSTVESVVSNLDSFITPETTAREFACLGYYRGWRGRDGQGNTAIDTTAHKRGEFVGLWPVRSCLDTTDRDERRVFILQLQRVTPKQRDSLRVWAVDRPGVARKRLRITLADLTVGQRAALAQFQNYKGRLNNFRIRED